MRIILLEFFGTPSKKSVLFVQEHIHREPNWIFAVVRESSYITVRWKVNTQNALSLRTRAETGRANHNQTRDHETITQIHTNK
jgi:hypothetical protein